MWGFKLVTESGDIYYYDVNELDVARQDCLTYCGTIYDHNGKQIYNVSRETF